MNQPLCLLMGETRGEAEKLVERWCTSSSQDVIVADSREAEEKLDRLNISFSGRASRIFCGVLYVGE